MRRIIWQAVRGGMMGIAAQYILAAALSARLHLGYMMVCIASLPERLGGEMQAIFFQMAVCALLGAGAAVSVCIFKKREWRANIRCAAASCTMLLCAAPAWGMALLASRGLV